VGGELRLILDLNSTSFSPQERFKKSATKTVPKVMLLMADHNPVDLIRLDEGIEMSLPAINELWKQVDLFCNPSLLSFIIFAFDINPAFGS